MSVRPSETNGPSIQRVDNLADKMAGVRTPPDKVEFTPESVREVVQGVVYLLDHFADAKHPGLKEPHNAPRRFKDTGVVVWPNQGGKKHLIGFQIFITDDTVVGAPQSHTVGVVFDLFGYESHGDRYIFNLLKNLAQKIREANRPSDAQLRELSTRFMLTN